MHTSSVEPQQERARVEAHIMGALHAAGGARQPLSPIGRLTRSLILGELAAYAREGVFPLATPATSGTPTFVDAHGTPCAMGVALLLAGQAELVEEIRHTQNHAYVSQLLSDERFALLLAQMGISPEEAAAIQPEYCRTRYADSVCGGSFTFEAGRAKTVIHVRILDVALGKPNAEILAIYGDSQGLQVGAKIEVASGYSKVGDIGLSIELERTTSTPSATDASPPPRPFVNLESNGLSTTDPAERAAHPLTAKDIADARLSSDCVATLAAKDAYWGRKPDCDGSGGNTGTGGCAVAGPPNELGILLAVAGAVFVRMRRRAR
jgi:hypothetical protein